MTVEHDDDVHKYSAALIAKRDRSKQVRDKRTCLLLSPLSEKRSILTKFVTVMHLGPLDVVSW